MAFGNWDKLFGGSSAKKSEAPEAVPEAEALETRRTEPTKPELKVVKKEEAETKTEAKPVSAALKWAELATSAEKKASSLFDRSNKYFREQKESKGSGAWADSAQKKAWEAGCSQIPRCELLVAHSRAYDSAVIALDEILSVPPPMPLPAGTEKVLASSGESFAKREANIEANATHEKALKEYQTSIAKARELVAFEKACVDSLEQAYNETNLDIAALEAQMDNRMGGKEQNLYNIATKAYDRLVQAEDKIKALKGGFLKKLGSFFLGGANVTVNAAEKELAEATAAVKEIDARMQESGLAGSSATSNKSFTRRLPSTMEALSPKM